MPKIHILPSEISNKIAAGEVVENPASVVKELIDNAIDAHADQITVEIEEGGIQKIKVIDNGSGMDEEDALIAFERHATSKISTENDILNIKTYGFRGEALSSIASVSKLTIRTRQSNVNLGIEIKMEGGQVISKEQIGAQAGTTIIVDSLFYNVPARKEFLKSAQTEYRNILEIIERYSIANSKVGFIFINNGSVVYNFPKDHQLEDRVKKIVGPENFGKLLPLFYDHPHIEIYGYVSKPEMASDRKKFQYIFINKRTIENKSIAFAVKDAYSSLIPKNTYPAFVLFIDVPSNIVDVNVHPRKEEVKFTNDKLIFESVRSATKGALDRYNLTPGAAVNQNESNEDPFGMVSNPFGNIPHGARPTPGSGLTSNSPMPRSPFSRPLGPGGGTNTTITPSLPNRNPFPPGGNQFDQSGGIPRRSPFGARDLPNPFENDPLDFFGSSNSTVSNAKPTKFKVFHNLYIVSEEADGISIYDQHALHERILYSRLKELYEKKEEEQNLQPLAIPIVINFPAKSASIFADNKNYFEKLGFTFEEFGPNTYKVTEVPLIFADKDIKEIIINILTDLEESPTTEHKDNFQERVLAYAACRGAYKAGDRINDEEIQQLLEDIKTSDIEYTCPHGRPLKVMLTKLELEKMFLRK